MFMVTVENMGNKFWLRSTTWAFQEERGDKFPTYDEAMAAIRKASKFMVPTIRRKVQIEEIA